jgi:hypothetical protein
MPKYTFSCDTHEFSVIMTFSRYDSVKAGDSGVLCTECGEPAHPVFDPGNISANFKEGVTGGWASKTLKEKENRARRWDRIGQKQKDHVRPNALVPNHEGVMHDRWSDIQDHVRVTKGDTEASTYDPFVKKEKASLCV